MTCGEFLARHSEYLDEDLGEEAAVEMLLHLAGCARCARYDRVLRRGLRLLREMEPVQPTRDPLAALDERLAAAAPFREEPAPRVPIAATVAVAGVLALVAWSALFRVAGVPATATGEPVRRALAPRDANGVAEVAGAVPVLSGMDLVGASRPGRAAGPLAPGRAGAPEHRTLLEHAAGWARADEAEATASVLPVRAHWLVPGPYTPLLLQAPEFGQRAQAVPVSAPGPR